MRPIIAPVSDSQLQKNFASIKQVLGGAVSIDNMLFQVCTGTTSNTSDSASQIIHSMVPRPVAWFPLIGDVYVQEINDKFIDVRATKPGVNFKIILIGGAPVTGESLVAEGSSSYLTTTQVIQQTPTIEVTEITDATILIQPTIVRQNINEASHSATNVPSLLCNSCICDDNYFYITSDTNTGIITRTSRETGICTALTLTGTVAYGPMTINNGFLYTSARAFDGGTTLNVQKIDLSAWTTSSVALTSGISNTQTIVDIYVDGTKMFISGTTGTTASRLTSGPIAGGAATQTTLQAATSYAKKIIPDPTGTYLYVIVQDTLSPTNIYKVVKSSLAIDTTYTTANVRQMLRQGVLIGTSLWMPGSFHTAKSATSQVTTYPTLMIELNTTTGVFTYHPYIEMGNGSNAFDSTFVSNLIENDGFLYSVTGESGGGCYVSRYDTLDNTQAIGWFPFICGSTPNDNSMGNKLVKDTDGSVIVTNLGTTARAQNFQWFKPDFSNVS